MARQRNVEKELSISYFEGINSSVGYNLAKPQEMYHAENVRSGEIGIIEKRQGTRRLGNSITATANYKIFYFTDSTNPYFYRVSTVGGITSIYYLNSTPAWTALTSLGTSIYELGSSTTQFDITNPSGTTFRYTWDTNGTDPNIDHHMRVGSTVVINAQNFNSVNKGTFTVTGVSANYFEVTNASGTAETNKTIGTGSITVSGNNFSSVIAENTAFLVNGDTDNLEINADGTTVSSSASTSSSLYKSPKARKINYYKDRLYLSDFTYGSVRYKNTILRSSIPVGIVSLVDGDHASGVTTLNVTDTKYIYSSDSLDVYRGGTKIETITITAKTENSLTVTATSNAIKSADELWVANTYAGNKVFRWTENSSEIGIDVKRYDTFKITGGGNERIKMMVNIGDVQVFGTDNSLATWNDSNLKNYDLGLGCVSDRGFVKAVGQLFFLHYTGIYSMTDYSLPRLVSSKIEKYITGATRTGLENACMGRRGLSIFCAIPGDVTLYNSDGSIFKTISDIVLERNLRQENWFVHTGIKATEFATYPRSTDADSLQFSSTESGYHVYQLFSNELDDAVTSDKEILFRADTNRITFKQISQIKEIILEAERGSDIKCFISLDGNPFYEISGTAKKGLNIFRVTSKDDDITNPVRCRTLRVSIRDFSKKLCKISSVRIRYIETMEEETNREQGSI